jgi:hypothetical protein
MTRSANHHHSPPAGKAKKAGRVPRQVLSEEPDRDFPSPDQTLKEIFDLDKADLLRDLRVLLRMVSKLKLDTSYDEDENYLLEELMEARHIVRGLNRIEHLKCIFGN